MHTKPKKHTRRRRPAIIDKSGFRHGEYVGYGIHGTYRIRREGKRWVAYERNGKPAYIVGIDLHDIAEKIRST